MAGIVDHNGSDWGGSVISRFQTCKRKHYWAMEYEHPSGGRGLELLDPRGGTASEFGQLIHIGLQLFYLNKASGWLAKYEPSEDGEPNLTQLTEPMTYGEAAAQAMLLAVNSIKGDFPTKELVKEELITCLDQYFTHYELEDLVPVKAEYPVSIKIGDFVHTGIIDLLGDWTGNRCVVDHKTTSLNWEMFFKKWRDVLSLKGYVYMHWKETGELVHIMINGIRRKKNKAMDCEFQRDIITYSEDDMVEFERTIVYERQLMDQCREQKFWPKSGDRCVEVWGECEFRRLCTFYSESMVKTFYKPRITLPLEVE